MAIRCQRDPLRHVSYRDELFCFSFMAYTRQAISAHRDNLKWEKDWFVSAFSSMTYTRQTVSDHRDNIKDLSNRDMLFRFSFRRKVCWRGRPWLARPVTAASSTWRTRTMNFQIRFDLSSHFSCNQCCKTYWNVNTGSDSREWFNTFARPCGSSYKLLS